MRIISRKKGKNAYFYIQYSFRKDGKVATKERYLGTKIPKNVQKMMATLKQELTVDAYKKLDAIKKQFQAEWSRLPQSAKEKEKEEIAIAFTYNTNAIEGSTITLHETREIIQDRIAPNKPLRDVKETEAHSKVFLQMLHKQENITETLLLRWHRDIFRETKQDIAGQNREYLVRIGSYTAPDWQDVPKLMKQLIAFIANAKIHPVELAARAHYRFELIHPFGDGNGRIGRLLMNSLLWHKGYPMLIIEYKKRQSYYKAFHKEEDGFLKYFMRRYLTAHKKRISQT